MTRIIKKLQRAYGKVNPLTINRGKVHDYLGMTLEYSTKGKVIITMYDYIIKMLAEIPDEWGGQTVTPATDNLFKINDDPVLLSSERKELSTILLQCAYSYVREPAQISIQPYLS